MIKKVLLFAVVVLFFAVSGFSQLKYDAALGYAYLLEDSYHSVGVKGSGDYFFNEKCAAGLSLDSYFYKVDDDSIGENPLFILITLNPHFRYNLLEKVFLRAGPAYEYKRYKVYGLTEKDTRFVAMLGGGMNLPKLLFDMDWYTGLDFVTSLDTKFENMKIALLFGLVF